MFCRPKQIIMKHRPPPHNYSYRYRDAGTAEGAKAVAEHNKKMLSGRAVVPPTSDTFFDFFFNLFSLKVLSAWICRPKPALGIARCAGLAYVSNEALKCFMDQTELKLALTSPGLRIFPCLNYYRYGAFTSN